MNFLVSVLLKMVDFNEPLAANLFNYLLEDAGMKIVFESGLVKLQK